ncbi:polysaccharide deacetylase family protein [Natranaerobius trueperi]|uniref:Polysaccharide deacetylase n=1 Tax=Natranaerobius trueperi TaxID=759412 RepID=A0A226C1U7_9FIRM|nr:polysaccharide deacetylase family protein [Natranaerobius trueperi]OWZ85032.1 polysaccharide deacetylase [Natranaerobius trueperi]
MKKIKTKKKPYFRIKFRKLLLVIIASFLLIMATGHAKELVFANDAQQEIKELKDLVKELEEINESHKDKEETLKQYEEKMDRLKKEKERLKNEIETLEEKESSKVAYLTFDDGPSQNTKEILDILKEEDIEGTFFVNKNDTSYGRKMYKRIVDEGHALGNHTSTHEYKNIYKSKEAFMKDFNNMEQLIYEVVDEKPQIMRFPGGSISLSNQRNQVIGEVIEELHSNGYTYFDWNVDAKDASRPSLSKHEIVDNVLEGTKGIDNAVILMHDSSARDTTVEALPEIISKLEKKGYTFKALSKDSPPVKFR